MTDAPGTSRILTLVFTDLAGSTALKTARGDHAIGELIARHRTHVRRLAAEGAGRVVSWAGDGCFLTFEAPSAAVLFALRLQQAHADEPDLPGVRTGLHMEVGIGTNNEDVASNMGCFGRPGSSLRAFRDALPGARIYGADVDPRILFREERIETFLVDQTNLASFDELGRSIEGELDLVIDDGLHAPNANLATLIFGLPRLKPGGWLVVEDIKPIAVPFWQVVAAFLPERYRPCIVSSDRDILFVVERT